MKAVVAAFNQEMALVEAFSVITNLRMQFGWNFLKHYRLTSFYPSWSYGLLFHQGLVDLARSAILIPLGE